MDNDVTKGLLPTLPDLRGADLASLLTDYARMAKVMSAIDAARFMEENFASAQNLVGRETLLEHACCSVTMDGDVLEFGVMGGQTLAILCDEFKERTVHGFDSFKGLPEAWTPESPRGTYSTEEATDEPSVQCKVAHRPVRGHATEVPRRHRRSGCSPAH